MDETDYTYKYRNLKHPVAGSLGQGDCKCVCTCKDTDTERELTADEEESITWLFRLLESERYNRG